MFKGHSPIRAYVKNSIFKKFFLEKMAYKKYWKNLCNLLSTWRTIYKNAKLFPAFWSDDWTSLTPQKTIINVFTTTQKITTYHKVASRRKQNLTNDLFYKAIPFLLLTVSTCLLMSPKNTTKIQHLQHSPPATRQTHPSNFLPLASSSSFSFASSPFDPNKKAAPPCRWR